MRILVAHGTRPEKIKMEPVVHALRAKGAIVDEWYTGQSPDLTGHAGERPWNSLHEGIADVMQQMMRKGGEHRPDAVLVQGDTATAFAVALGAFLSRIPVGHVEAGLRTYEAEPWPEEALRRMIAPLATWHFCPDEDAAQNVGRESGHCSYDKRSTFVVGNPVIDSLPPKRPEILVTLHRRENWGPRIREALSRLDYIATHASRPIITVITHPNWGAWMPEGALDGFKGLNFQPPMPQERFRTALRLCDIVVTDSGGLQEEAAYYGKPCFVVRTSTERTALAASGAITLVHPDQPDDLQRELSALLSRRTVYGTGKASAAIADILWKELGHD